MEPQPPWTCNGEGGNKERVLMRRRWGSKGTVSYVNTRRPIIQYLTVQTTRTRKIRKRGEGKGEGPVLLLKTSLPFSFLHSMMMMMMPPVRSPLFTHALRPMIPPTPPRSLRSCCAPFLSETDHVYMFVSIARGMMSNREDCFCRSVCWARTFDSVIMVHHRLRR